MRKEVIRTALREFLQGADLETATQRTVQQELEDRLGESLNEYKDYIRAETDAYLAECTVGKSDDLDENDFQQPCKRVKGGGAEGRADTKPAEGHPLSGDVYAAVRDWHGRVGVDIRQYYSDKEGQLKPGIKGLALSPQGWGLLRQALPDLYKLLDSSTSGDAIGLDRNQRASVSEFKGAWALDLRQWHVGQDAGLLPGKKGVRLDRQQVSALLAAVPALDVEVDEKGLATGAVTRPGNAGPIELGSNRRAEVTDFKGRSLLSLREYYEKDGQYLPGKRGIALASNQVAALHAAAPQLTLALERRDSSCSAQLSKK